MESLVEKVISYKDINNKPVQRAFYEARHVEALLIEIKRELADLKAILTTIKQPIVINQPQPTISLPVGKR